MTVFKRFADAGFMKHMTTLFQTHDPVTILKFLETHGTFPTLSLLMPFRYGLVEFFLHGFHDGFVHDRSPVIKNIVHVRQHHLHRIHQVIVHPLQIFLFYFNKKKFFTNTRMPISITLCGLSLDQI